MIVKVSPMQRGIPEGDVTPQISRGNHGNHGPGRVPGEIGAWMTSLASPNPLPIMNRVLSFPADTFPMTSRP